MSISDIMSMFNMSPDKVLKTIIESNCSPDFKQKINNAGTQMIYSMVDKSTDYLYDMLEEDDKKILKDCKDKREAVKNLVIKSAPFLVEKLCEKDIDYVYNKIISKNSKNN